MVMFIQNPKLQGMIILNDRKTVTQNQTKTKVLCVFKISFQNSRAPASEYRQIVWDGWGAEAGTHNSWFSYCHAL